MSPGLHTGKWHGYPCVTVRQKDSEPDAAGQVSGQGPGATRRVCCGLMRPFLIDFFR
jgi:hypothetical protein